MNSLAAIGTFSLGIAIMLLVCQGLSKTQTAAVKVFVSVTAAIIGGGGLLAFGSIVYDKILWPQEFWFYPVGLVIGFCLDLGLRAAWRTRDQQGFFWVLVICLLVTGLVLNIVAGHFSETPKDFIRTLADALFIAGVLAATVDAYIKHRTYREISVDVFKFLIGYGLPPEFKNRIRELVASSGLIRRDCKIRLKITPENEAGMVKLSWEVSYYLDNISDRYQSYQYKVSHVADDVLQEANVLQLWCHSSGGVDDYDMRGDALVAGPPDEAGDRWIKGKEIRIPPGNLASKREYEVGCRYESRMREQQSDYHVFMAPTIGATVLVECPDDFVVNVFPRPDEEHPKKWEYKRLMFVHDVIFVRWMKMPAAA